MRSDDHRLAMCVSSRRSSDARGTPTSSSGTGRLRGGRSADVLADALSSDPAEDVRLQAADALRDRAEDPVARRALARAMGDPSPEVALRAIGALRGRREREVAAALARRLGAG